MADLGAKVKAKVTEHGVNKVHLSAVHRDLKITKKLLEDTEHAYNLFGAAVERLQSTVYTRIAALVTRCLHAVLDEPYTFEAVYENKRNATQVRFVFKRDGLEIDDPKESLGGGVLDLAAFALRVAALTLTAHTNRQLLILDEPFRFLSADYRPAVRQFIEELSEELGFQFILVTHIDELKVGTEHVMPVESAPNRATQQKPK